MGIALSNLFSRMGDFACSDFEKQARKAGRIITNPFTDLTIKTNTFEALITTIEAKTEKEETIPGQATNALYRLLNQLALKHPEEGAKLAMALYQNDHTTYQYCDTVRLKIIFNAIAQDAENQAGKDTLSKLLEATKPSCLQNLAVEVCQNKKGNYKLTTDQKSEILSTLTLENRRKDAEVKALIKLTKEATGRSYLEIFKDLTQRASFWNRHKICNEALSALEENSDYKLTLDERKNLALEISNKQGLNKTQAEALLKTGLIPKDKTADLFKKICSACYNPTDAELNASATTIENVLNTYIDLCPQLDEKEREDILQSSVLLLIQRTKKEGIEPKSLNSKNLEGRRLLAEDLAKLASKESPHSIKEETMKALLDLATHFNGKRALSHTKDLAFHVALARNQNQDNAAKQLSAKNALKELGAIGRESKGGDGLKNYRLGVTAFIQEDATSFLSENEDLHKELQALANPLQKD